MGTDAGYVISKVHSSRAGNPVFEVVTDQLQRLYIQMRRDRSDTEQIDATIRHTITALARKPSPVR